MGGIRKQAITSSIVIYIGFLIGFINTWFFIKSGANTFTPAEYGLTRLFFDVGSLMYAVSAMGIISVMYKFFPYYHQHLLSSKIDLYSWALLIVIIGFILVLASGLYFEPLIVRKYSERSVLFVDYYHWIFVFGFGILMFNLMEGISLTYQSSVFPNFLRETIMRLVTFLLIVAYIFHWIDFSVFIKLFAFQFLLIAVLLGLILRSQNRLPLTFSVSTVTKKFRFKMMSLAGYVYGGSVIMILSQVADSIIIASVSPKGIHDAGVYNLATYIANLIQVPQRSIIAATIPVLSLAWKEKNKTEIQRIYSRSSINLLLVGLFIFMMVWLNIKETFQLLHIQSDYLAGIEVVFILGISKLIDAGTGVNAQIIGTSTKWRFEFFTGIILIFLFLPLNYWLIKEMGIIGSAYANLISFSVYNLIRFLFLWRKFNLQPYNQKTLLSILLAIVGFVIANSVSHYLTGWSGMILKSMFFGGIFITGIYFMKLSPDVMQLYEGVRDKLKVKL
jgi:O-antigen/teichoic acid export membrane protein